MKKKIVAMCATVAIAALAVGGTLAYFTDADKDVNVMTSGNVQIVQNETNRFGQPWQVDGIAELLPAVYLKADDQGNMVPYNPDKNSKGYTTQGPGGYGPQTVDGNEMWYTGTMANTTGDGTLKIYDGNINNEVDKVVSVTNKGDQPAYIRTIILAENDAENKIWDAIHGMWCNTDGQYRKWVVDASGKDVLVNIDGTNYSIAVCTYSTALAAGATSAPSLMQLFLDPYTSSDWYELLGQDKELSIIAISQAAQVAGFETLGAEVALNTAFGEVTAENVKDWYAETEIDTAGEANKIAVA